MEFCVQKNGALEYLTAPALSCGGAAHAFSTRFGGVSEGALANLNLGVHRGDKPENVLENYRILGAAVGFFPEDTVFTVQRHTDIIRRVGKSNRGEGLFRPVPEVCDGIITDEENVALCCFGADCATILLYDPVRRAIGAVHSGWRGTAQGIAKKAVEAMVREFGCKPENIRAAIGPSIGQCCFETDFDVPQAMHDALGAQADACVQKRGSKYFVDNKALCQIWLTLAGVTQIDTAGACTMCQPDRFWSHRVTGGNRGAQAAIIMLQGGDGK